MKKKMCALVLAMAMVLTSLTGCGYKPVDGTQVVMTVNGTEVTAAVANFYARYTQAMYETYYGAYLGEDMWTTDAEEGVTYEQFVKDSVLESLKTMVLSEQHMEELGVELKGSDTAFIEKSVKAFEEANEKGAREDVSGDTETVKTVMTLLAMQSKVQQAVGAGADTNVADEDAAQKKMNMVYFAYTEVDDEGAEVAVSEEEKADFLAKAEDISKRAKAGEDFESLADEHETMMQEATFDAETTSYDAELIKAADALAEGEVTEVIETEAGCYVAQLVSELDRDATDAKKNEIIAERKNELYYETVQKWIDEADIEVNEDVWSQITFTDLTVKMVVPETEEEK